VRTFPPYSGRRLLFGLAALPVVGLLVALGHRMAGGQFSLGLYVFATVTAAVILALVWFGVATRRGRPSGVARRAHRPGGAPSATIPWGSGGFRFGDFLVGTAVLFADITLFWLIAGMDESLPEVIAIAAPAAALASLMWHLRGSVAGVLLLSVVVGFPVGLTLTMFGAVMGNETSLLQGWLIGSGLVLVFALPYWWDLRRRQQASRFPTIDVPAWVWWTGISVLMMSAAFFVRASG
jgi:hypothetical protein